MMDETPCLDPQGRDITTNSSNLSLLCLLVFVTWWMVMVVGGLG